MEKRELVYLAIPYTWNGEKSFKIANEVAAELMSEGNVVFSPVTHSHPIADYLDPNLRYDQEFWMAQDLPMLSFCDKVVVVIIGDNGLELIRTSKGCQSELKEAERLNIPVSYRQFKTESYE